MLHRSKSSLSGYLENHLNPLSASRQNGQTHTQTMEQVLISLTQSYFKQPYYSFTEILRPFHWLFSVSYMMNHTAVLSQKPTHTIPLKSLQRSKSSNSGNLENHPNNLSANPTKWSNKPKQFAGRCQRIVWVCLIILWCWCLKG